jgi:RHS repeat-associated protein
MLLVLLGLVLVWALGSPADAAAQSVTVTVDIAGTGGGTVTSNPAGINCSGSNTSCTASFTGGAALTLTATPSSGHAFLGWAGICSGTGTCQFNALNGALAIAQFQSPTGPAVTYYHLDAIGSVRALTDGSGNVLIRHDYLPFGEDTQAMTGDPLRFTGQEIDAESGHHYFQARQYRQIWGRFTTVDPGHVNGSLEDPQGWNGYAYGRNNPLKFTDATGLRYDWCSIGGDDCWEELSDYEFEQFQANPGIWWVDDTVAVGQDAEVFLNGRRHSILRYSDGFRDGDRLPDSVVSELAPYFPGFDLTQIRLYVAPQILPDSYSAITFRNGIYLRQDSYRPATASGIGLIAHEASHSLDYASLGTAMFLLQYGATYSSLLRLTFDHNLAYENIPTERRAYALGSRVTLDLLAKGFRP